MNAADLPIPAPSFPPAAPLPAQRYPSPKDRVMAKLQDFRDAAEALEAEMQRVCDSGEWEYEGAEKVLEYISDAETSASAAVSAWDSTYPAKDDEADAKDAADEWRFEDRRLDRLDDA